MSKIAADQKTAMSKKNAAQKFAMSKKVPCQKSAMSKKLLAQKLDKSTQKPAKKRPASEKNRPTKTLLNSSGASPAPGRPHFCPGHLDPPNPGRGPMLRCRGTHPRTCWASCPPQTAGRGSATPPLVPLPEHSVRWGCRAKPRPTESAKGKHQGGRLPAPPKNCPPGPVPAPDPCSAD